MSMEVTIPSAKIKIFLIAATPALGLLGFSSEVADHLFGGAKLGGLVRLFNLVRECNIPGWYASALLLACAAALAAIAATKPLEEGAYKRHWMALSLIFLYISMDETAQIHELVNAPLRQALGVGGALYYAWVIPMFFLLIVLTLAYLKFLLALPPRFRRLFVIAAVIYVGGAFGTEFFVNYWVATYGPDSIYGLLTIVQELMELTGLSIFFMSLLHYLRETVGELRIGLG